MDPDPGSGKETRNIQFRVLLVGILEEKKIIFEDLGIVLSTVCTGMEKIKSEVGNTIKLVCWAQDLFDCHASFSST